MPHDHDLKQAARWHARLTDAAADGVAGEGTRAAGGAWLSMNADRRRAFAAVTTTELMTAGLRDDPVLRTLGDDALARAEARHRPRPRWSVAMVAAGAVIMPVAALTIQHLSRQAAPASPPTTAGDVSTQVYTTARGQQRLVTLPGSTHVLLDTASRLTARGSTLSIQGQAAITAGSTPFILVVPGARIGVRTGSLNVRVEADRTDMLLQGADATAMIAVAAGPRDLAARDGQIVSVTNGTINLKTPVDPGAITAWQTGWLQFDDVPLSRALREVNRYRRQPITLRGDAAKLRISGSFRTGRGDTFLDTVEGALPVTVDRSATATTIRVNDPAR